MSYTSNPTFIETLQQFKERTSFVYAPFSSSAISLNSNCQKKVNERGEFRSFYGDTVVYLLNEDIKRKCQSIQHKLYQQCEDVFAEPLTKDTFHVTLHDLNNGPQLDNIYEQMKDTEVQVKKLMNSLIQDHTVIRLKSTRIINMVNTSLVLCFEPESEEDCHHLMTYYEMFQKILPLSYSLTPHITLAYFNAAFDSYDENMNFRTGYISSDYSRRLKETVDELNQLDSIHLELSVFDLAYQHFSSMNHYQTCYQLKESILIADDAAYMRLLMKDILKNLPIPVIEADSIEQLVLKTEEVYPSIILLDSSLPNSDPYEVLKAIQHLHPGAAIISLIKDPLLGEPISREKILKMGASSILEKPLERESFKQEVLTYLHHFKEDLQ